MNDVFIVWVVGMIFTVVAVNIAEDIDKEAGTPEKTAFVFFWPFFWWYMLCLGLVRLFKAVLGR